MTVIDTTVSLTADQCTALRAADVTGVCRYIEPASDWKTCDPDEVGRIRAAGLAFYPNWENAEQSLLTMSAADTRALAAELVRLGTTWYHWPAGTPILLSADWNMSAAEWPRVAANLAILQPALVGAGWRQGLYGSVFALRMAREAGLASVYWQCMSAAYRESGHETARGWVQDTPPWVHLVQRRATTVAGISCDVNDLLIDPYGPTTEVPEMFLAKDSGGKYYLCDGIRSREVSAADAATIAYNASSGYGPTWQLMTGVAGKNPGGAAPHEWEDLPGRAGKLEVRLGWGPGWAGALEVAPPAGSGGGTPVDLSGLAAAVADLGDKVTALTAATRAGLAAATAALGQ